MAIVDENFTTSDNVPPPKECGEESPPLKAGEHEAVETASSTVAAAVMTVDETATISPEKEETANENGTPANDQKAQKATKGTCVEEKQVAFRSSIQRRL